MKDKFKETIKGILFIVGCILFLLLLIAIVFGLDAARIEWFKFLWNR